MTRPTFLSLFSGIGGLDLGLERAGWSCIGQVEIDPFCQRVLAKHWPDVPRWGDIREVDPDDLPRADLIAGGFPCQPVSQAGQRRGQDDERWLWPEFARTVRQLRPRWVLVENVPGLLVRGMGDVLGDLAEIGYDAEWFCLSAAAVGAPHLRDRVWIVAYSSGERHGAQPGSLRGDAVRPDGQEHHHQPYGSGPALADSTGSRRPAGAPGESGQIRDLGQTTRGAGPGGLGGEVAHANGAVGGIAASIFTGAGFPPLPRPGQTGSGRRDGLDHPWAVEPDVGRVAHGIPARLDRLRALGNAVVPQVAELIGRRILEADAA